MPTHNACRAIAAGLAAIGLAGCGGSAASPAAVRRQADPPPRRTRSAVPPARSAAPARSNAPARSTPTAPASTLAPRTPALRHLQAVLVHALGHEGPAVGAVVEDLDSGARLFSHAAGVRRPPASVEKLYTSVAVLQLLGPRARLHTEVLGTGRLGRGGVWHGNLFIRGDGDPTFGDGTFDRIWDHGEGPTAAQLAARLRAAGIRRVTGHVFGDASLFDDDPGGPLTGDRPDLPDYGGELSALVFDHGASHGRLGPAAFATREVVLTMRQAGISARASTRTAVTPPGARALARVASPPMTELLALMDVPSDDLFADLLAKQLGHRFLGRGTLAAGSAAIAQDIAVHYGLRPTIHDGSGLDKADGSSPAQVVSLLQQLWRTPVGDDLVAALPVVGRTGTVQSIGVRTPAGGRCVAKTGTLDDMTNLAGYCHAVGGHTLAFALMIDGPENWQALAALSTMVGAIAGY